MKFLYKSFFIIKLFYVKAEFFFKYKQFLKLNFGKNIILRSFNLNVYGYNSKLNFGNNISSRKNLFIVVDNGSLNIHDGCFFNNFCSINCLYKITIGHNCLFGENVKIYDHNHIFKDIHIPVKEQGFSYGEIVIGPNTWIGSNVTILKGTKIGKNCVIGANCLIVEDIPDNMIVKQDTKLIYMPRI